jgi:dinuclear metal center YbgI/SA1388 family protein
MITVNDIEKALFELAPKDLAMDKDYVGLQAGERNKPVKHVLLSLDVTQKVISEAVLINADLIVSHHGLWDVRPTDDTDAGAAMLALCRSGAASVAMHTNIDAAQGGINDILTGKLGLTDVSVFDKKYGIGRIGRLPGGMIVRKFAEVCKNELKTCVVRFHDAGKPVQIVAVSCGGGSMLLEDAIAAGCDTFFTGDMKYHDFLIAQNRGINLVECGHFATENVIIPAMAEFLQRRFRDITITQSRESKEPYQCL